MKDPYQTNDSYPTNPNQPAGAARAPREPAQRIGRYRVERILGEGGFGVVYLAHDDQLQRPVAIKVPHPRLVSRPKDAEGYLAEARTVAKLDHPHIVPVYDVGSTEDCPCFVVSKFIEGCTLAQRIKANRPSLAEAMEQVATVALALHYAHHKGLVHRDIKPGNILLDQEGTAYVADFGLALREQDVGKGPTYAGTPAYMSPEQARREGHRVDGRSDIFSLGVVFYELLVGRRPFTADSQADLMEQITSFEPRPPRQYDDRIPKELERICFKALSKRAADRYSTAKDMADDLRHFVSQQPSPLTAGIVSPPITPVVQPPSPPGGSGTFVTPTTPTSDSPPLKIVPKGLRSFDAHDADFFLELVPGPRDRKGLPDSIRFWKTRIEEADAEQTFSVGLIYGPSGCGKSSIVKAGLLPRLSDHVIALYVEATAEETETRLLNGLRKRCPALPPTLNLKETLAALRRGQGIPLGKKVLIVLDQFEQWLHAKREETQTELVQALRQCDGGRVQCIVMVRDDFWMAATRFMRQLEVRLVEDQNSAAVDLFDKDHARKVLAAFGRAFGKLPDDPGDTSKDAKDYLTQAVSTLAQEGKVICVRLALFAEMMKGKAWTPTTLKEVGGTEGIGVTFLEETFSANSAPPEHRYHQKAARAVLKTLLPESGSDIKGSMRTYADLLEASGYTSCPGDFDDLIRILNSEVRLITPTDPEGKEDSPPSTFRAGAKYYQLTHDYLVHSLREWLTRKENETRRGRAQLLLADRAGVWDLRPENRQLPSLWQSFQINALTARKKWTLPQRKMMRQATRYHALRGLVLAVILALLSWAAFEGHGMLQAHALRDRLLDADTPEVPLIVSNMGPYRSWINPLLQSAYHEAGTKGDHRKQLHAALALLPVDTEQVPFLCERLLTAQPYEVAVIGQALDDAGHGQNLVERLWTIVEQPARGHEGQRLRAACALAIYDPNGVRWNRANGLVVQQLVGVDAAFLKYWMDALRPVRGKLVGPLAEVFRDPRNDWVSERGLAASILAEYAADQPELLADLLQDADEKPFTVLFPRVNADPEQAIRVMSATLATALDSKQTEASKEALAKRQANAAVTLMRLGQPVSVWPLLHHRPDPRARSYLIHRLSRLGAEPKIVVKRLQEERDVSAERALLLALGEFNEDQFPQNERELLVPILLKRYRDHADAGVHGAAEWLLRQWKQENWLKQVNDEWAKDKEQQKRRLQDIQRLIAKNKAKTPPQWYVNGQGQTMVVIPGPAEFVRGSPVSEMGRKPDEVQHRWVIKRSFAIASKPITVEQFLRFREAAGNILLAVDEAADNPVRGPTWYTAAAYCNWLSAQEGFTKREWCYEPNKDGKYANGMRLATDGLQRPGYRLPTEAEWEYACRAGAITSRYFGQTEELLTKYACYKMNSGDRCWPVGRFKPNDLGLFDMHGNVWVWCQDLWHERYASQGDKAVEDNVDIVGYPDDLVGGVVRGGSFANPGVEVRSAVRLRLVPSHETAYGGFRPARTLR